MYPSGAVALFLAVVVAVVCGPCAAFPDGAPIEACIYGNKPNHYGTKPQPRQSMKLNFLASDSYYEPGSVIYGKSPFALHDIGKYALTVTPAGPHLPSALPHSPDTYFCLSCAASS